MSRNVLGHTLISSRTLKPYKPIFLRCSSKSRILTASLSSGVPLRAQARSGQPNLILRTPTTQWRIPKTVKVIGVILFVTAAYYAAHLERAPFTGRWRVMDVSPHLKIKLVKAARRDAQQEFEGKLLPPDHVLSVHIHRVANQILQANGIGKLAPLVESQPQSGSPTLAIEPVALYDLYDETSNQSLWKIFVVNDDHMVNARAEYGTIVIFTGILPIAKDEQGLAAIIAHEIGHIRAHHNDERVSTMKPYLLVDTLMERLFNFDSGLSRRFYRLFLACYDPRAALDVIARMAKFEAAHTRPGHSWSSTHPTFATRTKLIESQLPKLYQDQTLTFNCGVIPADLALFHDAQHRLKYPVPKAHDDSI
ncbi:hypothetical protein BDY19DRAFT_332141 [Irpex rosettiformis]|uniref:Uncharacterized protein n=1 Tax=Irpex rosettiformis TaxID=378272 RepID=A0ACB8TXV4_9APHY|nr:hypothetical protein BDY19DRAFT_332141 [Irpex rosettiformis]